MNIVRLSHRSQMMDEDAPLTRATIGKGCWKTVRAIYAQVITPRTPETTPYANKSNANRTKESQKTVWNAKTAPITK